MKIDPFDHHPEIINGLADSPFNAEEWAEIPNGPIDDEYIDFDNYDPDQTVLHRVKLYKAHALAMVPHRATKQAAAWDLYSVDEGVLYHGETKVFSTGWVMQPPPGYHIKLWARSGLGRKYGVGLPHGTGIVDRDYCGPEDVVKLILRRCTSTDFTGVSKEPLVIKAGDRVAQMTVERTSVIDFDIIDTPPSITSRGGFGGTGIR